MILVPELKLNILTVKITGRLKNQSVIQGF